MHGGLVEPRIIVLPAGLAKEPGYKSCTYGLLMLSTAMLVSLLFAAFS